MIQTLMHCDTVLFSFFSSEMLLPKHMQRSLIRTYVQSPFLEGTLSTAASPKDKALIAAEAEAGGTFGDRASINHVNPKPQGIIAAALKQNVTFI